MRGCNNFCSYCIVPYVRGRERSRSWQDIIQKQFLLVNRGKGYYSFRSKCQFLPKWRGKFSQFVKLNELDEIYRLRFITSHPKDLSEELIKVLANSAKICAHIHLPCASGSDNILKAMNRNYTVQQLYIFSGKVT